MAETVIETARLRMKTWDRPAFDEFVQLTNTPVGMRWLGPVMEADGIESLYARITRVQELHGHCMWMLERRDDGALVGCCGLKRVDNPCEALADGFEVGWRLREDMWGQGYAREAASAALDRAFGHHQAREVAAFTVAGNAASWGLMERLGMIRRPDLDHEDPRYVGDLSPTIVYLIGAAQWKGAH